MTSQSRRMEERIDQSQSKRAIAASVSGFRTSYDRRQRHGVQDDMRLQRLVDSSIGGHGFGQSDDEKGFGQNDNDGNPDLER